MPSVPRPIHDAAAAFDSLPGIGPRAALRFAYWLAAQPKELVLKFARTLESLANSITHCQICGMWTEQSPCDICTDPRRDQQLLCVVSTSQDVRIIEESGAFRGRYHVLGGLLDAIEGKTPEQLNIAALLKRLETFNMPMIELILALDPDVSGDTTALYLTKHCSRFPVKITRLARGLQYGAQLEYADGVTLTDAIQNRRQLT